MKQINKIHVYTCIYLMYRRIYRKALLLAFLSFSLSYLNAQQNNLDGCWRGIVFTDGDSVAYRINLTFNGNKLVHFSTDYGSRKWLKSRYLKSSTGVSALTLLGEIKKNGEVRSEQYIIQSVNGETATISWLRGSKANNYSAKGREESWSISGTGYIQKD